MQVSLQVKLSDVRHPQRSSTHRENVPMFPLHAIKELGSVSSKFQCVAQPWDQPFVERGLALGSEGGYKREKNYNYTN